MWCPECNISGGCDCSPPPKVKYIPEDPEKELEKWNESIKNDIAYEIEEEKIREERNKTNQG